MADTEPFNPAIGQRVLATDASGIDHEATVVKGPWRGYDMPLVTVRFEHPVGDDHVAPWPLSAVRALGIQEGGK